MAQRDLTAAAPVDDGVPNMGGCSSGLRENHDAILMRMEGGDNFHADSGVVLGSPARAGPCILGGDLVPQGEPALSRNLGVGVMPS
jgi:hypothetical protein